MPTRGRWSYIGGFVVCVALGLVLGVVFSIAGGLMYLVRGGAQPDWFDVGIGTSIVWYLASFGFAGLVAAVLNPLGRTKWGAITLGIISTIPLALSALYLLDGTLDLRSNIVTVVLYSIGLGGPVGFLAWKGFVGLWVR